MPNMSGTDILKGIGNDLWAYVSGSKTAAKKGYFHNLNTKKNKDLEDTDAEIEGRKTYPADSEHPTGDTSMLTPEEDDSENPKVSRNRSPILRRKA